MLLGHTCVCAVEIEPYCRRVLLQRQRDGILPRFPIWDDVRTFDGRPWRGFVDAIHAGIPCQRVSCFGAGGGFLDQDYYAAFLRIVSEVLPAFILVENSPLLIRRGLARVLGDLARLGYACRWGVLGAWRVGLDSRRNRIWIVAHLSRERWEGRGQGSRQEEVRAFAKRVEARCGKGIRTDIPAPDAFGNPLGVAHRMDRLTSIGNGQVPAVAATAFRILSSL
jgi:DNA (cytosine-5)-methyltransferase 1